MFDLAEMSRLCSGVLGCGTVNSKTLTVAFMEFLQSVDSNSMKSIMLGHGFQDVSPLWGDKPQVPTFKENAQTIAQWPEFQQAMTEVEADWYYLSGHHGRQFAEDGEELEDGFEHYNVQECVGFFNHVYHDGRWSSASQADPYKAQSARDVFMKTSQDDWVYELGPEDNPLYNAPHEDCRGVMLVGCNTLRYRTTREKLVEYFPNAMVLGLITRENNSIAKLTKLVKEYGRDFLVNPTDYDPPEIVQKLNPVLAGTDMMGVIYDGTFYVPTTRGIVELDACENLYREQVVG